MSQTENAAPKLPPVKVFRLLNRVIRPLLASRLHRLLSGRVMLLSYTGRKTGRDITVPISYFAWDPGTVLAMSSQLSWIPNLRTGPTVRLRIRGREHDAVPTVFEDHIAIADLLAEFARRNGPRAAKALMLGLPGDRQPAPEELRAASQKTRLVVFRLAR
ncbi:nitroreductase/quinone reductase family protein [Streptomyces sp. NPDC047061]|uniref:nitroreductase/quinone reductase family protein n=1 Tax=Streptomyces sp. NPDC047061 TaxID=3154605 RepID=UPI0033FC0664